MEKMQHFRAVPIRLDDSFVPENNISERVQILRTGSFSHPQYGDFAITQDILRSMVKNFGENVRRVDVAIDYAHESDKIAAAWVQGLDLADDDTTLWATVKWTPRGKQKLIDREYRYLSADFTMDYVDSETLQKFGPTLFGAGLTNRPYVKDMAPAIELNEGKGISNMDPKDKQIAELQAQIEELKKQIAAKDAAAGSESPELADAKKKLEESAAKVAELEEKVATGEKQKALAEKNAKFAELMKNGKAVEAQRDAYITGDLVKFSELSQPVKLSELGKGGAEGSASNREEAEKQILALAEKKRTENKGLAFADSISLARSERPDLVKLCS